MWGAVLMVKLTESQANRKKAGSEGTIIRTGDFYGKQQNAKLLFGLHFPIRVTPPGRWAQQLWHKVGDLSAALGNVEDLKTTWANLFRKECRGCNEARHPSPAGYFQSFGASVTSLP